MSDQTRKDSLNAELRYKILHHLPAPRLFQTPVENFYLVRREEAGIPEQCFEKPLFGFVVQGTKCSFMGGKEYSYTEQQSIVAGIDMPISSYVLHPSHEKPFLFVYLYLDRRLLSSLVMDMHQSWKQNVTETSSISIAETDADILEMLIRLVDLLEKPAQIAVRAPMMLRELHYLLLISPHGPLLRQLNTPGTQSNQIVQAVAWIRENYAAPMRIEALARHVNMSTANFHRHFKQLTGFSPLQYQKQLRLHEAQRLMLLEHEKVSEAALRVGYESMTQFNREYKRVFGEPPLRDMNRRRAAVSGL